MKCLRIRKAAVVITTVAAFAVHVCAQNQGGAIVAIDEGSGSNTSAEKSGTGTVKRSTSGSRENGTSQTYKAKTTSSKNKPSRPGQASTPTGGPYKGPVLGDTYSFLNFEVISAEKPIYRRAAKQSGAHGLVQVAILVDTDGSVLQAKARTGSKLLWDEAERAALASKLNRPILNGQAVRALGFLVYRFGAADEEDDDN